MRLFIALLAVVLVVGCTKEPENLIKNGSFENGMDGWRTGSIYIDRNKCVVDEGSGRIEARCKGTTEESCPRGGIGRPYEEGHYSMDECFKGGGELSL